MAVLLSLSTAQKENAIAKMIVQIQTVNGSIDNRCAQGEEVSDRDDAVIKVRKMRSMLAMIASS